MKPDRKNRTTVRLRAGVTSVFLVPLGASAGPARCHPLRGYPGDDLFQPPILALELAEPAPFGDADAGVFALPAIIRLLADPRLAAHLANWNAILRLPQCGHDCCSVNHDVRILLLLGLR